MMHELLNTYGQHTKKPGVTTYTGREKVAEAYRKQVNLGEDVQFMHTKADVPMMGFDIMHELRYTPSRQGNSRHAIMAAPLHTNISFSHYQASAMKVTWIEQDWYTAPVEWSLTKSSLLIATYDNEPQAILIIDPLVALAFGQIWDMLVAFAHQSKAHSRIAKLVPKEYTSVIG
jgi:hypothetical protein